MKRSAETTQRSQRRALGPARVLPAVQRLDSLASSGLSLNRFAPRGSAAV